MTSTAENNQSSSNQKRTVLIVDDEAHVRIYISKILNELGVENCLQARNGQEAIDTFHKEKPDIVFMDVNMPKMSGIDALEHLTDIYDNVVVVMMSSVSTRNMIEKSAETGAVQYILKSTPKKELLGMISEIFEYLDEEAG